MVADPVSEGCKGSFSGSERLWDLELLQWKLLRTFISCYFVAYLELLQEILPVTSCKRRHLPRGDKGEGRNIVDKDAGLLWTRRSKKGTG